MGAKSRTKGSGFEREVSAALFDLLGVTFERDLDQYRKADRGDLVPDDASFPFLIECKRYAAGDACLPAWKAQAVKAAQAARKLPAVVFRFDRRQTRVALPLRALCPQWPADLWAETTLDGFAFIARELMADSIGEWSSNDYTALHRRIVGPATDAEVF